mgnify:FL=1
MITNVDKEDVEDVGEEEFQDDLKEDSIMYTDENIDEVLGKDEDDDELETMVDDELQSESQTEEDKIKKELDIFTPKEHSDVILPLKPEIMDKSISVIGNYENVYITNQVRFSFPFFLIDLF